MASDPNLDRLRGWKSIAAYLSVTQSTVIRWANGAGLPVIRSTKGATVYALRSDLDEWLVQRQNAGALRIAAAGKPVPSPALAEAPPALAETPAIATNQRAGPAGAGGPHPPKQAWYHRISLGPRGLLAVTIVLGWLGLRAMPSSGTATDTSPASAQYLAARVDWASRTPAGIMRSIAEYQDILHRDPSNAKAFIGLADAYVLSCEFAHVDRAQAFSLARQANAAGLMLSPDDPDGNRIAGFVSYWTDRDIDKAAPLFEASIRTAPDSYLAHLWYGNALVDAGRLRPALDHLDRALALAPDSPAVHADYAVAMWQTGQDQRAKAMLGEVEKVAPDNSSAPSWLALFDLQSGDIAGYIAQSQRWVRLIDDPPQARRVAREAAVFRAAGPTATLRFIAAQPVVGSPWWHGGKLAQAIAASQTGDRARLIRILRSGQIPSENWRDLRFPAASFVAWRNDHEVSDLLDRAFRTREFSRYPGLTK